MATMLLRSRRRSSAMEHPVELRFVDMLLIIIAVLVTASVVSIRGGKGADALDLSIRTMSVPTALVNKYYRVYLAARGGSGSYRWHFRGELPTGLKFDLTEGIIQGRPSRAVDAELQVWVTDGRAETDPVPLDLKVISSGRQAADPQPPSINSELALLSFERGTPFRHSFALRNGVKPVTWQSKFLPDWLAMSPGGELTLRKDPPAGDVQFTVDATEATGQTVTQQVQVTVLEKPDNLFWRVLRVLRLIVTWIAYLFLAVSVFTIGKRILFGWEPSVNPGSPGILRWRRRRSER